MEEGEINIILIGAFIITLFLYQQQILTQGQTLIIVLLLVLFYFYIKRQDIFSLLEKKAVTYTLPDVFKEFNKIRGVILKDYSNDIIIGELTDFHGEPEFGSTANQPTIIHYIAKYCHAKEQPPVWRYCKISQSVLHTKKENAGIISIITNYYPLENCLYSKAGSRKYTAGYGERFYMARARRVIAYDESVPESEEEEKAEEREEVKKND